MPLSFQLFKCEYLEGGGSTKTVCPTVPFPHQFVPGILIMVVTDDGSRFVRPLRGCVPIIDSLGKKITIRLWGSISFDAK